MVLQVAAIFGLLLSRPVGFFRPIGMVLLWAAVAVALLSAVDYINKFRQLVLLRASKPNGKTPQ
jgi:phosphatidylglycerophosphate synthase